MLLQVSEMSESLSTSLLVHAWLYISYKDYLKPSEQKLLKAKKLLPDEPLLLCFSRTLFFNG